MRRQQTDQAGASTFFHAGESRPFVTAVDRLAHRLEKFLGSVVMPPAPALAQLDDMGPATLRQCEPFARYAVVRTLLPCRHKKAGNAHQAGLGVQCRTRARDDELSLKAHNSRWNYNPGGDYKTNFGNKQPREKPRRPFLKTHAEPTPTQQKCAKPRIRPVYRLILDRLILLISLWKKFG